LTSANRAAGGHTVLVTSAGGPWPVHNTVPGSAGTVVQAGSIDGGVHLHPAGLVVAAALVAWLACTIADAVRGEVVLERARPRLTSGFLAVTAVVSLVFWVTELTI